MPGGAVVSRHSLRDICGGTLRPATWRAVNCRNRLLGDFTGAGAREEGRGSSEVPPA